jgi:hypothetical protein
MGVKACFCWCTFLLIVENMSNEYSNIHTSILQNARVRFWMLGVCGGDVR